MSINQDLPRPEGLFERIIQFSIQNAIWVMLFICTWIAVGIYSYQKLPVDAVPDITNTQVQINTQANGFTALEIEQRITYPIENAMAGIPDLELTRSISRYGLSQVTVVFKDGTDIYWARQQINQRVQEVQADLPKQVSPSMSPLSTGLGEIYQWVLKVEPNAKKADGSGYTAMDLREIQDWIVRPQLQRVKGVAEVNSIGGFNKTYVVSPDLSRMQQLNISLDQLQQALTINNENRGAGFIEDNGQQLTVRIPDTLDTVSDIENTMIASPNGSPIRVGDIAQVLIGHDLRTGGATYNGEETVLGIAMMAMGENSRTVSKAVDAKIQAIQNSLPQGVRIETVYDRTGLVEKAIKTVQKNLIEGAILVIVILFLFLGNIRAALITACVIPLSMLFTLTGMAQKNISANLMSLGALDFGIIVDGAVVIVENCMRRLAHAQQQLKRELTQEERFKEVFLAARQARRPLIFGQLIILVVYFPIFALSGVEAKMFHPMALTVVLALVAAIILSISFVPAAVALWVKGDIQEQESRWMLWLKSNYQQVLDLAYQYKVVVVTFALCLLVVTALISTKLGSEFAPQLSEGDFAVQQLRSPITGLEEPLRIQENTEKLLLKNFPEIKAVFARTGTKELAAQYGLSVRSIQDLVAASIGGQSVGEVLEGDRRFDFVVRLSDQDRNLASVAQLPLQLPNGGQIVLADVAMVSTIEGVNQVSRENGKRRIVVTTNVEGRDLGSYVAELQKQVKSYELPSGYWIEYGGQFENLASARSRMQIVIPLALLTIFILLMAVFHNVKESLLVFTGVPFALTGGVLFLWLRDIPLSMSAGIGFIALSGVAVLNGLVMLTFIKELRYQYSLEEAVWRGAILRLRPVLMTACVASLGFVPMALATGTGAEVQRPLATVVIGGIISSTLLTLVLLPVLYLWIK